jgi:hypothetical protein
MQANARWSVINIAIGTMLALACYLWNVSAIRVEGYNAASSSGFLFTAAENKTLLVQSVVPNLTEDNNYLKPEGSMLSPDLNCSTDIILAVFFKARYCKTGTLIVVATSELNSEANLDLFDYGPMKWESENQRWFVKIRDLETNPAIVTVGGTECATQAPVLTAPSGCDAKIAAGPGE